MILLSALVTARREFLFHPSLAGPLASLLFFFCVLFVHQTESLQCHGNDDDGVGGGGSSGSRKSQINPFVIPHRSFQPVRISTTSLLCHLRTLPKLFPPFLFRLPAVLSREILQFHRLYLSPLLFPFRLTLPYFRHFFFPLLSFALDPRCAFASSLARSSASSSFFVYPLFAYSVRVISPVLLLILIRAQVSAACPDRICFVCFSCATLTNRNFLAIHAYHHYDIWRRELQLKWGPPGFETTFVTVGSANRNWSSCCGGRDKEIY